MENENVGRRQMTQQISSQWSNTFHSPPEPNYESMEGPFNFSVSGDSGNIELWIKDNSGNWMYYQKNTDIFNLAKKYPDGWIMDCKTGEVVGLKSTEGRIWKMKMLGEDK